VLFLTRTDLIYYYHSSLYHNNPETQSKSDRNKKILLKSKIKDEPSHQILIDYKNDKERRKVMPKLTFVNGDRLFMFYKAFSSGPKVELGYASIELSE
jgi:hypothetical protein